MTPQSIQSPSIPAPYEAMAKMEQIMDPARPLCREETIWMLEFIKKKVAEGDPNLMDLPQPRLMQNFRYFAEIALMLIQRRNGFDQEADRLRAWLLEAAHGLHSEAPQIRIRRQL